MKKYHLKRYFIIGIDCINISNTKQAKPIDINYETIKGGKIKQMNRVIWQVLKKVKGITIDVNFILKIILIYKNKKK